MHYFIWGLLGIVMLLCRNLLDSRKGRAVRSLRGGIAMVEASRSIPLGCDLPFLF